MRIIHTIDSAGLYGAETMLLTLAAEQQRLGDTPIVLSIGNPQSAEKAIETEAARRELLCVRLTMRDGLNLAGGRLLFDIALRQGADVIHSHGYKPNILLAALPRFLRTAPIVATLHGWTATTVLSRLALYRLLDRLALRRFDAVVAVNPIAVPGCEVHVIANGIATDAHTVADDSIARRIRELRQSTGIVIGAVGRLSPEKNFGAFLSALGSVAETVGAAILGDGPEAAALKDTVIERNLTRRVVMAGYVTNARQYLPLFDLLVIPSLTEGLPMILLEAMAANLPIIATKVGAVPATLGNGGLLVEPGNLSALATALQAMTSNLPHYTARASSGSKRVLELYSPTRMAIRYDEVYRMAKARTAHSVTCVLPPK